MGDSEFGCVPEEAARWYVGALTDWTGVNWEIDFHSCRKELSMEAYQDGVNADRQQGTTRRSGFKSTNDETENHLAPGEGGAATIHP